MTQASTICVRITCAILFTFFSRHSCRESLSPGRAIVGRAMPGRFPQKYRPRWAAEMSLASTTTGFVCGRHGRRVTSPAQPHPDLIGISTTLSQHYSSGGGGVSRYRLSTVSNLANISVQYTGVLHGEDLDFSALKKAHASD